jgi:hypothetical protein
MRLITIKSCIMELIELGAGLESEMAIDFL